MPFVEYADFLPQFKTLSRKMPHREGVKKILHLAAALGKKRNDPAQAKSGAASPLALLTKRERQLAKLALTGKTYPEIAASLGLAPSTVKRTFATIHQKLGTRSRKELASKIAP